MVVTLPDAVSCDKMRYTTREATSVLLLSDRKTALLNDFVWRLAGVILVYNY